VTVGVLGIHRVMRAQVEKWCKIVSDDKSKLKTDTVGTPGPAQRNISKK